MSSDGILLGDTSVHTLLYADDLVLIGKDAKDLQKQLDALDNFTKLLNMEVNLGKTKVMVFQKNKKKSNPNSKKKTTWRLGVKEIDECDSYKYLGVTVKTNGSFSEHVDKVKDKAQKAYFSLITKSREWGGFQPRLFLYLLVKELLLEELHGFEKNLKMNTKHCRCELDMT